MNDDAEFNAARCCVDPDVRGRRSHPQRRHVLSCGHQPAGDGRQARPAEGSLPGFWEGTGFSLIARPDFGETSANGFFLELNWLRETIEFTTIGSPVFNRGSKQGDIQIYGLTYLHRVTDGTTGGALHIEPGLWLNIPATSEPKADASIARLFSIPHGNAVNTVGFAENVVFDKQPEIPPAKHSALRHRRRASPARHEKYVSRIRSCNRERSSLDAAAGRASRRQ